MKKDNSPEQQALLQTTFDRVWVHLNKQGTAAVAAGACVYLAPDLKMCAVGCLLDRSQLKREIEGMTVNNMLNNNLYDEDFKISGGFLRDALLYSGLDPNNSGLMRLLADLQTAHDETLNAKHSVFSRPDQNLHNWQSKMNKIADFYNLIRRPIDYILPT